LQYNDEKRITQDVIYRFLGDAADIGVRGISFVSDGESTCSPHLYDAIIRGHSNGLSMALGTNGFLLKRSRLRDILPRLDYLRFNISATTPKRYSEIHGCSIKAFHRVVETIRESVTVKKELGCDCTIGLQMVTMPSFGDQILPLARLGKQLGVDYTIFKHCSDDENGALGINYKLYNALVPILTKAEALSTPDYIVKAKWSKLLSGGKRDYERCYGPAFIMQFSGSGLVAPCGMLFAERYGRFHIGNIVDDSFKRIWQGERYWQVLDELRSERFNAKTMCGSLCLQHKVNEFLWLLKEGKAKLKTPTGTPPKHINFV
jgi:MoaA/NifB/PqqE/SkfB family radical SAM enzyme